ncbi:MAG: DsbA family protein [Deltaproteobacteria bacterium]|nr:DsbA family protein [Deltaproteobacteria bacterium]
MLAERLEKDLGFQAEWKGLEIHPETPPDGMPVERRSSPHMISVLENIKHLSRAVGLEMSIQGFRSNSRLSLEGAEFARDKGRFAAYNRAVFEAYFQKGRNIGDMTVLEGIAREVGLEPTEFREALMDGRYHSVLADTLAEAQRLSIPGVPAFIFGERVVVGAQPYETLRQAALEAVG